MLSIILYIAVTIGLIYLTAATLYLLVLAVAYSVVPEPTASTSTKKNRFAMLIPAHNEELLISRLCESLLSIDYPLSKRELFIIVDNCSDKTAEVCRDYPVTVLVREDPSHRGKGFALRWALERIPLLEFDAACIVDADNVVAPSLLTELNGMINQGERAIQCYNSVENREDSWFTQLLFVSRTIGNLLYHHAKYKLGLSSYLMGNGICFRTDLLIQKGWTAFTEGEDWEYYAQLIEDHVRIGFAVNARVYHQESRSLDQATSQRMRWASGRFRVARTLGLRLFQQGLSRRDWFTVDASLPLIFPNYSLQFNLTVLMLIVIALLPASPLSSFLAWVVVLLMVGQVTLFVVGACLAGNKWGVFKAFWHAPVFLIWKLIIDLQSIMRSYRKTTWVRTRRHLSGSSTRDDTM